MRDISRIINAFARIRSCSDCWVDFFVSARYLIILNTNIKQRTHPVLERTLYNRLLVNMIKRSLSSLIILILTCLLILPSRKSKLLNAIGFCLWEGLSISVTTYVLIEFAPMLFEGNLYT